MVDQGDTTHVVVDASPLIYLAKLRALEVFTQANLAPLIPEAVAEETTRPSLIYRHPDAALIESAIARGEVTVVALTPDERQSADRLAEDLPGMHIGEIQVLVMARSRGICAVVFERRARAIAGALGVGLVDLVELIVEGTSDVSLLEERVRSFAELVNMRLADYEMVRERIAGKRFR